MEQRFPVLGSSRPLDHHRPASIERLDEAGRRAVGEALAQGANVDDVATLRVWLGLSQLDAFGGAVHGTGATLSAPKDGETFASSLAVRAVPTRADARAVDAVFAEVLSRTPRVPAEAALWRALSTRSDEPDPILARLVTVLAGASLAEAWRSLVEHGRVGVTSAGGLGGAAMHLDPSGDLLVDKSALAKLPPDERERACLRAVLTGLVVQRGADLGIDAKGAGPALAHLVADVLTGHEQDRAACPGGRVYYPAGGSDVPACFSAVTLLEGARHVVSVDLAYTAPAQETVPGTAGGASVSPVVFDKVPGDAITTGVADRIGGRAGAVILLAPGDFGGLRRNARFMATTLGALHKGGTVLNFHAWGYAPLAQVLPLAFFGLTPRATGRHVAGSRIVEIVEKTRDVPEARFIALHAVDRLANAYVARQKTGTFGTNLEDGLLTRTVAYDRRPPFLPELGDLAAALDALKDPIVSAHVWSVLLAGAQRADARTTPEELCFLEAKALLCGAHAPVALATTSVVTPTGPTEEAADPHALAIAAAALLQGVLDGRVTSGSVPQRVELIEAALTRCIRAGVAADQLDSVQQLAVRAERRLALELLDALTAGSPAARQGRASLDPRPIVLVTMTIPRNSSAPDPDGFLPRIQERARELARLLEAETAPPATESTTSPTLWARAQHSLPLHSLTSDA